MLTILMALFVGCSSDKHIIGANSETTKVLNIDEGEHTLTIINSNGDSDSINFKIIK